jgi:hypothetical protein
MKKRVVKLDQRALRGLIKEAIQGRQPGSPLFTPPREKRQLREHGLANPLPEELADRVQEAWEDLYDPGDPSMEAAGGQAAWASQVASAADEFAHRVNELLEEIEGKLINGEYFRG